MTRLSLLFLFSLCYISAYAQQRCGTMQVYEKLIARDSNTLPRSILFENALQTQGSSTSPNPKLEPNTGSRNTQAIVVIPVVVHVVYNTSTQNISEEQIRSQISILNSDYRMTNSDTLATGHPFWASTADAAIEFCLATTDPNGNPSNGITRTFTTTTRFDADTIYNWTDVKYTSTGGQDNWDPTRYLNVWVCNLTGPALAFSSFPTELITTPSEDGITVGYRYFGTGGTSISPYNLGRTMTHEVGHWLGLKHIWGDAFCGTDFVVDTKAAESENYGCPSFPQRPTNTCGGDANGEMYMNFMDYVNDNCMNMFTYGQVLRMQNTLTLARPDIASANRCVSTASIHDTHNIKFGLYPIPAQKTLNLYFGNAYEGSLEIRILNSLGQIVQEQSFFSQPESIDLDISSINQGSYFLEVSHQKSKTVKRIVVLN